MLYKGIANRQFNRSFQLADYVEVEEASLKDGMLTLDLVRNVPEALKPKKIKLISK
jgi:molecular chaperone IbpA